MTNVTTEETNKIIEITQNAKDAIANIFEKEKDKIIDESTGLRMGVIGGGCSGLSYKLDFGQPKEKDYTILCGEVKIYIDLKSAIYLKGITLDFKDGLKGKGFSFINPNAANTCGCGESFSV